MSKKQKKETPAYDSINIDGAEYRTLHNKMHALRKPYVPADQRKITSFMPGNIQEVFVKEGDTVEEGGRLCILEAMKMKNIIIAPMHGKIGKIHVSEGDRVPKNFVLIEMA